MVGFVMGLVLYRFSETVVDPDLSGHLKFGQLVWETGKVAMPDPFSYVTAGRIWVNHEWLAEVIWYLAFAVAGPAGLIGLKVSLSAFSFTASCTGISAARTSPGSERHLSSWQ